MAEETAFENSLISNFEGLVTLTLDQVIVHTVVHHSSTSTYLPNFIKIEETFCGRMGGCSYAWTFETGFIWSILSKSRPNKDSHFSITLAVMRCFQ